MLNKEKIIIAVVFFLIVVALVFIYKREDVSSDYDFKVYFFNAGKADAIVLSKNGK